MNTKLNVFDWRDCKLLYGPFDCFLNSTVLYLKQILNIDISDLSVYNFNIAYSQKSLTFSGTIPIEKLMEYLVNKLDINVEEIYNFEDVPPNRYFLIALDTFDLPYMKDSYQIRHQIHYVLAFNMDETITLWDPYYMVQLSLSLENCKNSWLQFHNNIYIFDQPLTKKNPISLPYILSLQDYESQYNNVYSFIKEQFNIYFDLQSSSEMKKDLEKKLFGMIRNISISRMTYFTYQTRPDSYEHIINYWRSIEKFFFKIPLLPNGDTKFFNSVQDVFEMELVHLKTLQY
ncbi:hypothetical protein KDC22_11635 [Paenibacillus tritici]|uniref:hypothetical protein n=1 Tax=Paenibacillus tritici TaxID=1873425 RepID=UPI001BAA961D|nr:hypothetical protein [Paenibacillus tritici]QUL57061.1 hypothetical protein KDC22_11635 [Paenibacillus tritici]